MACDRIKGVLQTVLHSKDAPGLAEDLASNSRWIPPYYQDPDGEIEGPFFSSSQYGDGQIIGFYRRTIGERFLVRCFISLCINFVLDTLTENTTEHRARTLFALLPIALATGYSEVEPQVELLKVL